MNALPRSFLVFAFCLPLAVILGFVLATPLDRTTMALLGGSFFLLLTPLLLTSHHTFLILSCVASVNIYFLPGQPQLWLIAAAASCFFSVLTRALNRGKISMLNVPSVTAALIFLFIVTVVTAHMTGGIGVKALSSAQYGGRKYVYLWGAIAVYFAISAIPLAREKRLFASAGYFLSGVTSIVSNIAYTLGPNFYFLFLLFPAELAMGQAVATNVGNSVTRISGTGPAAVAIICFILLRYGLKGLFTIRAIWRPIVVAVALGLGLFSGFRSIFAFTLLLLGTLFIVEGLYKTRYCLVALVAVVMISAVALPFADRLPLSVQRGLSLLPLDLDRAAVEDARGSTQWRIDMWQIVAADVPKYFWLGKGYAIDPTDLWFAQEISRGGGYEGAIIAGDYHSGPLTLLLPFGVWGAIAFVWFIVAGLRVLYLNMKNSEPEMKQVNTFLFGYFITKLVFYLVIFGAFYADMLFFCSVVALSISANRGVRKTAVEPALEPVLAPAKPPVFPSGRFQPA